MAQDSRLELYSPDLAEKGRPIIGYLAFEPHGFVRLHCLEIDGLAVWDGDVVLGTADHMRQVESLVAEHGPHHFNPVRLEQLHPVVLAAIDTSSPWPDREIYYSIDPGLTNPTRVTTAIANWHNTGYFTFYNIADTPSSNYILFQNSPNDDGTYSNSLGMKGGEQGIFLSSGASAGSTTHEIGHALGLNHEQKRHDAPSYLSIVWANIDDDWKSQYLPARHGQDEGPYNYGSIMQYREGSSKHPKLVPLDANATIGQRTALSTGDIDGALAIYDISVGKISVTVSTGENGTDDDVYLGLGGREFLLDTSSDDFESNATDTFVLGDGSNVENATLNDPTSPALTLNRILGAPAYLRLAGGDGWRLDSASITVDQLTDNASDDPQTSSVTGQIGFQLASSSLHLGSSSSRVAYFEAQPPKDYDVYQPQALYVQSVTVTVNTGSSGTDSRVYLGLAGREFWLNTSSDNFQSNSSDTMVFGKGATIASRGRNDPRISELTQHDLDVHPMYLRLDGDDGWDLSSVVVLVTFQATAGATGHEASAGNQVILTGAPPADLYLDDRSGRFCYLQFDSVIPDADLPMQSITATVITGADGTDDDVYLGLAGREFLLDTSSNDFQSNATDTFILGGSSATVENASLNDPTSPQLDVLQLDTYPAYLRVEGSGSWDLSSVSLSVAYTEDGSTSTATLSGTLSDLTLSPEAGQICSLIRDFS